MANCKTIALWGRIAAVLKSSDARPFRLLVLSSLLIALAVSCRKPEPVVELADADNADAEAALAPGHVSLELKNERVDEVLEKLAASAGKAIVIDAEAQSIAHCARITLLTGGSIPAEKALGLVREALEPSGFTIAESPNGGLVVRRNADKPPPATCTSDATGASAPPDLRPPNEATAKFGEGVHRINDTEFEITRDAIKFLVEDPNRIAKATRVVPAHRDGKTLGFKLFAIRPNSALGLLGLQNGDLVTHIGDKPITSPEEMLEAYAKLKNAKSVELRLERRGEPKKLLYKIKD